MIWDLVITHEVVPKSQIRISNATRISIAGEQTNLITIGIGIQEVVILADGKNITTPLRTIIKEIKVEQMKFCSTDILGTFGKTRETTQAFKIIRTKI